METPEPRDAPGATSIDSDIAADAVSNAPLPDTAPDAPPNTGAARGIAAKDAVRLVHRVGRAAGGEQPG